MKSTPRLLSLMCVSLSLMSQTPTGAADAQPNRIRIEYFPPSDPAHQPIYELLKERRALEKLQEIFGPFRLPIELTLQTGGCYGVSNAWYYRPAISVCYEYVNEIHEIVPKDTTASGITPADAVIGQFFYVFAHEMGHAVYDILRVPVLGSEEDAADHFAAYLMLQFDRDQARRLIIGAAYAYDRFLKNPTVTVPLVAFSGSHSPPAQRFFNLICLAFGSDETDVFADLVALGYLPSDRAPRCKHEFNQLSFAFRQLVLPHIDKDLAKQVLGAPRLPDPTMPGSRN